jgi:large subunit ribosomal protein L9
MKNLKDKNLKNQLLLIADVDDLGRSGDLVKVKPGYARNFLLPQQKAIIASPSTIRLQEKLKKERAQQAEVDKKEAEILAAKMEGMSLSIEVKVDPDGHMYGSITALDIASSLGKMGFPVDKKQVVLALPLKTLGVHPVTLKLKEGVPVQITLKIESDSPIKGEASRLDGQGL